MRTIINPPPDTWKSLCERPSFDNKELEDIVRNILDRVKNEGDRALYEYTEKFDGVSPKSIRVAQEEIRESGKLVTEILKNAIKTAKVNIGKFHSAQPGREEVIETSEGVRCWRKSVPIEKVGLYIPGGTAPLFSTVLMLAVPAKIAGCSEITLCTPPDREGKVNPLILYTASLSGVTNVFRIGGAQAIAAMAFGTKSIPKVDKIFGPGNQYVTKAKELVQLYGTPIDIPAGPSEVLVIADETADPEFIAADLLSQAEHGTDSQVVFLTNNSELLSDVRREMDKQIMLLPRKEIALESMNNSHIILFSTLDQCTEFSNLYAPEHLIIVTANPHLLAEKILNAGSVFLGKYSCESAGDYASGTNHTLPTNGYARSFSGVSTDSFMKKITFQEITAEGLKNIGPAIELLAEAEFLEGHKNAVTVRLNTLKNV
jgi:histidinol dehydrogenase